MYLALEVNSSVALKHVFYDLMKTKQGETNIYFTVTNIELKAELIKILFPTTAFS